MKSDFPKIGNPAQRALEHAGIFTMKQLSDHTKKEILALHGMGPKAMGILEMAMREKGLFFKR